METLERMALSTGMSTWDAMGRAIEDRLLPARALQALSGFKRLIEDARAMLGPGFADKLTGDVTSDSQLETQNSELMNEKEPDDGDSTSFACGEGEPEDTGADTSFDTSFNFNFDFGPSEEISTIAPENATDTDADHGVDFNPFAPVVLKGADASAAARRAAADEEKQFPSLAEPAPFRKPGDAATLPELIKFLNDRSGYIRALEEEATPESFSRIEKPEGARQRRAGRHLPRRIAARVPRPRCAGLGRRRLLVRRACDSDGRCTPPRASSSPSSFLPAWKKACSPIPAPLPTRPALEEERRLCYVGMTRAMDTLVMTRARYRRRYGNDMPEASIPSRFLEEVPGKLVEDLGSPPQRPQFSGSAYSTPYPKRGGAEDGERHYSYEDESQDSHTDTGARAAARAAVGLRQQTPGKSMDNIASFFATRGGGPGGAKFCPSQAGHSRAHRQDRPAKRLTRQSPKIRRRHGLSA